MGERRSRCRETDLGEIEGGLREGQSIGLDDSSKRWRVKGNKVVRTLSAKRVHFFSSLLLSSAAVSRRDYYSQTRPLSPLLLDDTDPRTTKSEQHIRPKTRPSSAKFLSTLSSPKLILRNLDAHDLIQPRLILRRQQQLLSRSPIESSAHDGHRIRFGRIENWLS